MRRTVPLPLSSDPDHGPTTEVPSGTENRARNSAGGSGEKTRKPPGRRDVPSGRENSTSPSRCQPLRSTEEVLELWISMNS
jgi:hypothetical protein